MNYIAALLILHLDCEEDAFWALIYIMNDLGWRGVYTDETPKLMEALARLDHSLKIVHPDVHFHLEKEHAALSVAFSSAFITLYVSDLTVDVSKRIFELFLLDGEDVMLAILMRMLE